jgi:two-component system, chemotaxis family, protein-glutamate methylesterase/glutaminase
LPTAHTITLPGLRKGAQMKTGLIEGEKLGGCQAGVISAFFFGIASNIAMLIPRRCITNFSPVSEVAKSGLTPNQKARSLYGPLLLCDIGLPGGCLKISYVGAMASKRDIVVVGGSAGSLEPLKTIVGSLPGDFSGTVFVVIHLASRAESNLAEILSLTTALPSMKVERDQTFEHGKIYVAPPDRHLVVGQGHLHLTRGPKEGLHRPSINVTFRTAAAAYRDRVVGVLLSGMLDDGASGLWEIARNEGVTIVQDLKEAPFPSMPLNALEDAPIAYQLSAIDIGPALVQLTSGNAVNIPNGLPDQLSQRKNHFSGFTCPECRGPLYERLEPPSEFRCRVGHVFPLKTLIEEATATQERKMYEAVVALEEGAELAEYAVQRGVSGNGNLRIEAEQLRKQAEIIRKLIQERTAAVLD